ncbi:hypothetical protein VW098_12225 [Phaeobacter sp. JH57H2]|uniref:hypothetical protein n=1 Tax=unclassified Phaeobacter TaxID=2621772 RepID=UPI003A88DDCA
MYHDNDSSWWEDSDVFRRAGASEAPGEAALSDAGKYPALSINLDKYQSLIDSPDLSNEERREVVLSIWSMLMTLIDMGIDLGEIVESA